MRLRLKLAYDGACFRGWQSQPGGGSVQDKLQEALTRLAGGKRVAVHGSGRTDAGVHALGQVAHAEVPEDRGGPAFWQHALNAMLPPTVRVLRCTRTPDDFHARYSATGKTYEYLLWTGPVLPPHLAGRAWHVRPSPDLRLLRRAARILRGRHDFRGFAANRRVPVQDTRRIIRRLAISANGPLLCVRCEGDGFLYKMMRMMVAALVRVGQQRATTDDLRARLAGREGTMPRAVAPPDGLYLAGVTYGRRTQSG